MSNLKTKRSTLTAKRCYLDYASTTPLDPRVLKAMQPFFGKTFGNPGSIHTEGVEAKKALDAARTSVARALEARAEEIIFTSGGTEANNLAIFGILSSVAENRYDRTYFLKGKVHVVTTNIEHASVLEPLRALERKGSVEVTYVPVSRSGIVEPEKIVAAIRPNTVLVSVMYANNEIGTIQPIRKIAQALRNLAGNSRFEIRNSKLKLAKPIFHVDACQAPLYLNCLVNALGVDLLTLDAHKLYGPKGVGALYVRRGIPLAPVLLGGGQERGLRSTTPNIPAIVGFAEALRIATAEREKESIRIAKLRDHLYFLIRANKQIYEMSVVNGSMEKGERLPNNLNISFPGVDTEFLTLKLDAEGIAVSTKSSCLKDEKSSYVVAALGGGAARASSTLRFTLGRNTTKKNVEVASDILLWLLDSQGPIGQEL